MFKSLRDRFRRAGRQAEAEIEPQLDLSYEAYRPEEREKGAVVQEKHLENVMWELELALLESDRSAFLLVATPRADTIAEAAHFGRQLEDAGISVRAAVINRAHPRSATISAATAEAGAVEAQQAHALTVMAEALAGCGRDELRAL